MQQSAEAFYWNFFVGPYVAETIESSVVSCVI
jgi:hypothetical protein